MRLILCALALCAALASCATPETPVFLERANVLPLQINDAFQFRKVTTTFYDPRIQVATKSETAGFKRRYMNFGAITSRDLDAITGNYFDFHWRAATRADVTVRLEYRQAALGNFVMAQELYYPAARGTHDSAFRVTGDEYFENGRVTAWRGILIVDGRIAALTQSFMWK